MFKESNGSIYSSVLLYPELPSDVRIFYEGLTNEDKFFSAFKYVHGNIYLNRLVTAYFTNASTILRITFSKETSQLQSNFINKSEIEFMLALLD